MSPDERSDGEPDGFLPPMPAGPEPDLGTRDEPQGGAGGHQGFLPPEGATPQAYAAAPPSQPPASSGTAGAAPQGPQDSWAGAPVAKVPDNGDALAGVILSGSAAALLLLSVGISSIISVVCAGLGIHYSRKGRARVDRGETPKHRGVAQAGFVTGIVTLVLSILATIFWAVFAVLFATDEDFRQDLEDELDGEGGSPDGFETAIPLAGAALRALALLLR